MSSVLSLTLYDGHTALTCGSWTEGDGSPPQSADPGSRGQSVLHSTIFRGVGSQLPPQPSDHLSGSHPVTHGQTLTRALGIL